MRKVALSLAFLAMACGPAEEERAQVSELPPQATASDTVIRASSLYDPRSFEEVSWASDEQMLERGAVVFQVSCSKCHGTYGDGGPGILVAGKTIKGPSLIEPDWALAGNETLIRQVVFTGTTGGMPHWGLKGLKYRDIQAVAGHVDRVLRTMPRMDGVVYTATRTYSAEH